ncbi:MAG: NAD-dependent epimerase/dehydratase family protein [Candidatus Melainabacteria bacterium]|nr:NAD-dependent epimerase/dehydratase family protein [Candidatus Melainabacteria bacterium]
MKKQIKNIFITGGAGFIGSHLVEELIKNNFKVTVFDNLHRNSIKYTDILKSNLVTFIKGNILNKELVEKRMKGHDLIIHAAAIAGVSNYHKFPYLTFKTNLIGTYNILEAMVKNKTNKLIDFSTSEVFGPNAKDVSEDSYFNIGPPKHRRWSYAGSKIGGEFLISTYAEEYKWSGTIIRPFNIYGPKQTGEGAISSFCKNIVSNKKLILEGDGKAIRSWCYIDDFISAIMLVIKNMPSTVETFNIGNPKETLSNIELARLVLQVSFNGKKLNEKENIKFELMKYPEIKERSPNIHKFQKLYNWSPKVSLREGLQKTLMWFKQNAI